MSVQHVEQLDDWGATFRFEPPVAVSGEVPRTLAELVAAHIPPERAWWQPRRGTEFVTPEQVEGRLALFAAAAHEMNKDPSPLMARVLQDTLGVKVTYTNHR